MVNKSYAAKVTLSQLIIAGLKAHLAKLSHRGMNEEFVTNMEKTTKKLIELNSEQEGLKARLKEKTAEIEKTMKDLTEQISESKKVIKLALESPSWKEFGIS